jgi:hypothetical protein
LHRKTGPPDIENLNMQRRRGDDVGQLEHYLYDLRDVPYRCQTQAALFEIASNTSPVYKTQLRYILRLVNFSTSTRKLSSEYDLNMTPRAVGLMAEPLISTPGHTGYNNYALAGEQPRDEVGLVSARHVEKYVDWKLSISAGLRILSVRQQTARR